MDKQTATNTSHLTAHALTEHLEEYEEECEMEIELDVVALRGDYSEYATLQDWLMEYYAEPLETAFKSAGVDLDGDETDDEKDSLIRSHIQDHGQLIEFSGGIIVSAF